MNLFSFDVLMTILAFFTLFFISDDIYKNWKGDGLYVKNAILSFNVVSFLMSHNFAMCCKHKHTHPKKSKHIYYSN